jgi:probable phosphomutase (TIGR03848 family)
VTRFLLIRHGLNLFGGERIAGRTPGVNLSPDGSREAEQLVERLHGVPLEAIYSSPMERTLQTAQPLAAQRGLALQTWDDLIEIDYGDWTGAALADLRGRLRWTRWNSFRSGQRVPNGESMIGVQARIVSALIGLSERHGDASVAVVSHGDVIKAAIAHCLGSPLDLLLRIEISTASVSVVDFTGDGPYVRCVNNTGLLADVLRRS